jgi:hypothetical protein
VEFPPDQRIVVEVWGPGEWIVSSPEGVRSLHVYRLAAADWLVSEVGRTTEGRGSDLQRALADLSSRGACPRWWGYVAADFSKSLCPMTQS